MASRVLVRGLDEAVHRVLLAPTGNARSVVAESLRPLDAAAFVEVVGAVWHEEHWSLGNRDRVQSLIKAAGVLHLLRAALLPAAPGYISKDRFLHVLERCATRLVVHGLTVGGTFFPDAEVVSQNIDDFVAHARSNPAPEWAALRTEAEELAEQVQGLLESTVTLAEPLKPKKAVETYVW